MWMYIFSICAHESCSLTAILLDSLIWCTKRMLCCMTVQLYPMQIKLPHRWPQQPDSFTKAGVHSRVPKCIKVISKNRPQEAHSSTCSGVPNVYRDYLKPNLKKRICSGGQSFECTECVSRFFIDNLKRHIQAIHKGAKPFKWIKILGNCKRHEGTRPFKYKWRKIRRADTLVEIRKYILKPFKWHRVRFSEKANLVSTFVHKVEGSFKCDARFIGWFEAFGSAM